jgi:hypothetical protein
MTAEARGSTGASHILGFDYMSIFTLQILTKLDTWNMHMFLCI